MTDEHNSIGNDSLQMYAIGWLDDFPDPYDFLTTLFGPNAASNGLSGSNATPTDAWALLAQADVEQDTTHRYALYNQAEQLMVNEVAATTLWEGLNTYAVKPWVTGYALKTYFLPPNAWANVQIQAH